MKIHHMSEYPEDYDTLHRTIKNADKGDIIVIGDFVEGEYTFVYEKVSDKGQMSYRLVAEQTTDGRHKIRTYTLQGYTDKTYTYQVQGEFMEDYYHMQQFANVAQFELELCRIPFHILSVVDEKPAELLFPCIDASELSILFTLVFPKYGYRPEQVNMEYAEHAESRWSFLASGYIVSISKLSRPNTQWFNDYTGVLEV